MCVYPVDRKPSAGFQHPTKGGFGSVQGRRSGLMVEVRQVI